MEGGGGALELVEIDFVVLFVVDEFEEFLGLEGGAFEDVAEEVELEVARGVAQELEFLLEVVELLGVEALERGVLVGTQGLVAHGMEDGGIWYNIVTDGFI